jgi:hypothetical protein
VPRGSMLPCQALIMDVHYRPFVIARHGHYSNYCYTRTLVWLQQFPLLLLLVLAVDDGEGYLRYEGWKVTINLSLYQYLIHWISHKTHNLLLFFGASVIIISLNFPFLKSILKKDFIIEFLELPNKILYAIIYSFGSNFVVLYRNSTFIYLWKNQ